MLDRLTEKQGRRYHNRKLYNKRGAIAVNHKWGDKTVDRCQNFSAAALETICLEEVLRNLFPAALKDIRESAYHFRHASKSVMDAAQGGPAGYRAVKTLEEAVKIVKEQTNKNKDAAKVLGEFYISKSAFAKELTNVYSQNETVARVAERVKVQLKGSIKNFFEVGNDVKPAWIKENVDAPIISSYGKFMRLIGKEEYKGLTDDQLIIKAIENSDQLRTFYSNVKKFYDAREKNEDTIMNFCNYLEKTEKVAKEQNAKLEKLFPKAIESVKKTYGVEDKIFKADSKGTSLTSTESGRIGSQVKTYRTTVDNTRSEIGQIVPMPIYNEIDWVDIATNPFALAAAAVLLYKGFMSTIPFGSTIDNAVSKTITNPVRGALNGANTLYDKARGKK